MPLRLPLAWTWPSFASVPSAATSPPAARRRVRSRLLLPATVVTACLTAIAFARAWQLRTAQEDLQRANALELAIVSARTLDATIATTQTLLVSLSELLDPTAPPAETDAILKRIFQAAPVPYSNLWITDPQGRSLGVARSPAGMRGAVDISDRAHFKAAIATRRFAVSGALRSRVLPGAPLILTFAMPVLDSVDQRVEAVVGASIQIDSLEAVRLMRTLPDGSVMTIIDTSGTIIYRTLDPENWIGRSFRGDTGTQTDFAIRQRVGAGNRSADGTVRLIGTKASDRAPWVIYVGIPVQYTLDVARNQFLRDVLLGVILAGIVLWFAYAATVRVVAPIETLTADATAIARGDMTRRSSLDANDEIGDLARAFNQMADTVVQRNAELEASQAQLLHAQKMEALGSFAGGIAHDFNNHLHAIVGHTELAAAALPPGSDAREDLAEVLASAQRAANLTRQILIFSRKQLVEPQLLDVNTVVRGIERMLTRIVGEERQMHFTYGTEPVPVVIDHGQLEQVVVNLVANARDATRAGGRISVQVGMGTHAGAPAGRITVQDDGVGMDAHTLGRIFDPFFSTKGRTEGTGLGLAMAHGIVEQAGGRISATSALSEGTTFTVLLPIVDGKPAAPADSVRPAKLPAGRGRILLAEDDDAVRATTSRMLERAGYQVVTAADGVAALRLHESAATPFDLLLTDVVMPRMSGAELASRLKSIDSSISVLFMSGYADDADVRDSINTGSATCIAKPFSAETLLGAVSSTLNTGHVSVSGN